MRKRTAPVRTAPQSAAMRQEAKQWDAKVYEIYKYLADRRLVQIATMGAVTRMLCDVLFERLGRWLVNSRSTVGESLAV